LLTPIEKIVAWGYSEVGRKWEVRKGGGEEGKRGLREEEKKDVER
jgi:hypothetical protein